MTVLHFYSYPASVCGWLWRLDGAATEKRGSSMRPGVTVCRKTGVAGTEGARAEQQSGWKEAMCTSCTYRKYLHKNAVYRSQMAAEWKLLIIACFDKVLFKKEGKINDRDSSQQHIKRLRGLTGITVSRHPLRFSTPLMKPCWQLIPLSIPPRVSHSH